MILRQRLKRESSDWLTEEDIFADDADLEETVDFSTGEVVEEKKQETDSKIENTQILDNA